MQASEKKAPYIKDKEMWKAVNFARVLIAQGDKNEKVTGLPAKHYKVDEEEFKKELVRQGIILPIESAEENSEAQAAVVNEKENNEFWNL